MKIPRSVISRLNFRYASAIDVHGKMPNEFRAISDNVRVFMDREVRKGSAISLVDFDIQLSEKTFLAADEVSINAPLPTEGKYVAEEKEETHELFDFLHNVQPNNYATDDFGLIDGLAGLLPVAQGEDYEEQAIANRIKKKVRKRGRN